MKVTFVIIIFYDPAIVILIIDFQIFWFYPFVLKNEALSYPCALIVSNLMRKDKKSYDKPLGYRGS